jgi:hypothetical protein
VKLRSPAPVVATVRMVLARPHLWGTGVRVLRSVLVPGWWRRWPPAPVPPAYAAFRLHTALGDDPEVRLEAVEVVAFLEWCRRMHIWQQIDPDAR